MKVILGTPLPAPPHKDHDVRHRKGEHGFGNNMRDTNFIRPNGSEKVTGVGRYTADLTVTGMAHATFRYADHPHARIRRIDTTRARALPGVVAVVTQEDL